MIFKPAKCLFVTVASPCAQRFPIKLLFWFYQQIQQTRLTGWECVDVPEKKKTRKSNNIFFLIKGFTNVKRLDIYIVMFASFCILSSGEFSVTWDFQKWIFGLSNTHNWALHSHASVTQILLHVLKKKERKRENKKERKIHI